MIWRNGEIGRREMGGFSQFLPSILGDLAARFYSFFLVALTGKRRLIANVLRCESQHRSPVQVQVLLPPPE